ncbi:jerky protein homolog-like [Zophobas morio]|uniref:jerky protein homolog-like n=1 Tax=Zophobas morio TaxID=2755281 RepID=UPI003083AFB5
MSSKANRQLWEEKNMAEALRNVREKKMGWQLASKNFNVPATTLRRRFKNNCNSTKRDLGGKRPVFSREMENQFVQHIKDMEAKLFGLTLKDLKKLIFEFASKNNIKKPFNKEKETAGDKWIQRFLTRNPQISLRRPENTSAARAQAFNKNNIALYFKSLNEVMEKYNFPPENVYNIDESGLSVVQNRPQKILATKGRKHVGALSSAERGHLTVVCCMNATCLYISKKKNEKFADGQRSNGQQSLLSTKRLDVFRDFCTVVLFLLDGHSSHKSLEVLQYAKDNGVILFCFPAHCTHRLQPLDTWLKQHPGRIVTHFQVAGLFNKAYLKAATPANAVHAFAKTGIYPFDDNIFPDWMFQPSSTTDRPLTEHDQCQNGQKQPQQGGVDVELPKLGSGIPEAPEVEPSTSGFAKAKCTTERFPLTRKQRYYSIHELSPLSQASLGASRKRLRKPSRKQEKCGFHVRVVVPGVTLLYNPKVIDYIGYDTCSFDPYQI